MRLRNRNTLSGFEFVWVGALRASHSHDSDNERQLEEEVV